MSSASLARAHYRRQQLIAKRVAKALAALWVAVDLADLDGSWALISERAAGEVALAQYQAASQAADYVRAVAAAQGITATSTGLAAPRAFSGTAADGRSLSSLLLGSIIDTKVGIAAGMSGSDALRRGLGSLILYGSNETQQSGRNADHVTITAQPALGGYVRVLSPPSCSRCAVLAGKFFRWNAGFQRHPHCDCVHLPAGKPANVAGDIISPRAYFDSLSESEQSRVFGVDNARAIRDGADIGQVVNARRGMDAYGVTTREGANVNRGRYGRRVADSTGQLDRRQRLQNRRDPTPDMFELADVKRPTVRAIYDLGLGRAETVALLGRYGYLL